MKKNLNTRTIVIVVTILICIVGIIGIPKSVADLKKNFRDNIRLGLDLRGGSHLVLQVRVHEAIMADANQTMDRLKEDYLKKAGITYTEMSVNDVQRVEDADQVALTIKGIPPAQSSAFKNLVAENFSTYSVTVLNSTDYSLKLKPTDLINVEKQTVQAAIDTIGNRIDSLGLAEKTVTAYGRTGADFQILVQLPGVDDPAHVQELIGTAAKLEICAVKDGPFGSKDEALAKHNGVLPLNTRVLKAKPRGDSPGDRWYIVDKHGVVSGDELRNARAGQGDMRKFLTSFTLSPEAGKRFARYTEANIGNNLAVVLDDYIVSVAVIQSRIEDSGQIEGLSTEDEAVDLSRYLRSGSLPAGVDYLEVRSIGPSLGADSVSEGMRAGVVGLLAVVIVMLLYYRRSGVNAVLALILNTVILLAAVSYFHAVLTLPGIAGVILTIGMAVDSNVLIFERIREELRTGKSVVAAVDTGFGKAWWTIVDTHVTTVVSCAFLFLFGEGPVKGFAVTLTIGLIANVFTAVFVSRTIFDYELSGRRQLETLSI
jgi:preprotein translocase subunit SecD